MFILRAEETSPSGRPRSELSFGELARLAITRPARRKDVRDPVRASAFERDAVVYLEGRDEKAVSALAIVTLNEATPLGAREVPLRLAGASAIRVALGSAHLGMGPVVDDHRGFVPLRIPCVTE